MSAFHGVQGKGAMRRHREILREEDLARRAKTEHVNTKFHRLNSDDNARCSRCTEPA